MYYLSIWIGLIAVFLFLILRVKKKGLYALYTKGAASLCFVFAALFAIKLHSSPMPSFYFWLAGLTMGMLGDIALDLKYVDKGNEADHTRVGIICFSVGHIMYIQGLLAMTDIWQTEPLRFVIPLMLGIIVGTSPVILEKQLKMDFKTYKPMLVIYGSLLTIFAFTAASFAFASNFQDDTIIIGTAGILFLISDLILTGIYFDKAQKKNTPINVILNHLTYYAAQYLIATSILC